METHTMPFAADPAVPDSFEALITGLMNDSFGTLEQFISKELCDGLRNNLIGHYNRGEMFPAGTGKDQQFQQNAAVRGDLIKWIDNDSTDSFELDFLQRMAAFSAYLNATCYSGIRNWEFHYALYNTGSFYKRHRDQFQRNTGRKFSIVHYLNENWNDADGGQLILHTASGQHVVLPESGRVVFFRSDETEHEVLAANRPRMSITGWLKDV